MALVASAPKREFSVSVRELVEFALRSGDLGGERDFVGPGRARAGIRGHQKLQNSRPAGYEKEVPVAQEIEGDEFTLKVQGRLDGLIPGEPVLLEEIKTVQGRWDGLADPLHWAQLRCYGHIYAGQHGLQTISLQLTYLNLDTGQVTEFSELATPASLQAFFEAAVRVYLEWVRERYRWCLRRDESIRELAFPFPNYRPGQRELAVAAYRALVRGERLFLEAPTGIGKTISVLFPALKAMGEGRFERLFYLTARTVGRSVAEKALADLRRGGLQLRTLTLTAREKICVRDGHPCDPQTCPFALGYYDRNKAAMREALRQPELTRAALETVALKHQVCPFELGLDVSVWVDAIICDYNYVFDPKVYLRRHFGESNNACAFLVDEAHNLVDRGRDMFSAELDSRQIRETKGALKKALPRCGRALTRLNSALRQLASEDETDFEPPDEQRAGELGLFGFAAPSAVRRSAGDSAPASQNGNVRAAGAMRELPAELLDKVDDALKEAESWLARNEAAEFREPLLECYFRLFSFRRTAELYDERYMTIAEPLPSGVRVRLFCLDPSFLLAQALERAAAAVFFSATLTPLQYYRELLGGKPSDPLLQLPSPFPPEHLAVLVEHRLRTDFKTRASTLGEVVEAVAAAVAGRRGNYLVYLPSYQYLNSVYAEFEKRHSPARTLIQRPGMTEAERDAFLAAFSVDHREALVGFAVMGGIFGEGIDLAGDRLLGVIIVGVGLPQLCLERDLIRDYFQAKLGSGFDYAYTFPGVNRVLQAVGRVIRSETDRGVALLIDARFAEHRYRRLFPRWWRAFGIAGTRAIRQRVAEFWNATAEKF